MDRSHELTKAFAILEGVSGNPMTTEERKVRAIALAGLMLQEARKIQTSAEARMQAQLARMMDDPIGKVFTTDMTDQCFRSQNPARVAHQLVYLLEKYGTPGYLSWDKKVQLWAFKSLGRSLPNLFVPLTKHMLRKETSSVILPGENDPLIAHVQKRTQEGVRVNLNRLGEAVLGEEEASRHLQMYLSDLANPAFAYISIKISTICSQLNLLAWENTVSLLSERLKLLYRAAESHRYLRLDGISLHKFVNLDMEEYRDLHLTVAVFRRVLDDPEFLSHSAGIVLQSYLPDSHCIQKEITEWAMQRVARGGAPIKIRLVKGANLAMEQVEAALRGWPQAPYEKKSEVDANYARMVLYGCEAKHARAVILGIGSHNLFSIAYALLARAENGVEKYVGCEMLEGMADHMRRVVQALAGDMLLYCPAATREEFQNAVAYLVRRLDENTAPENFLRHTFGMVPGSKAWEQQAALFSSACDSMNCVSLQPRRSQDRTQPAVCLASDAPFENEPDTDWSLPQNRKWAEEIIATWRVRTFPVLPLVIGGEQIITSETLVGRDPSCPGKELYRYASADSTHIERVLCVAKGCEAQWKSTTLAVRSALLGEVAQGFRRERGNLIGAMVANSAKTIPEADVEISEAIDFIAYYRRSMQEWSTLQDIVWESKGTVLVAPPWNFPCAIAVGGIAAALAAGNCVIFKPAAEAVLVGWHLAQIFWNAGIGQEVLQFISCVDEPIGSQLIGDARINCVILTGSTETAKLFLRLRPGLDLMAETGGKNAIIVTSLSDRDLAIKDLVASAFSHAGQKCSACSLAICEPEVYDDPHFRVQLCDAAKSWRCGSAWDLATRLTPLISPPNPTLLKGLTSLEEGEEWLLAPKQDATNPNLWSPGIKLGVKSSSFTYQNELFGPVLGMMRANNLEHALQLANGTPYGLTSGLHSLDEREQAYWSEQIQAGNCYINRSITGAIVQRQPFGGCKQSSFGPGLKAGGPNYLLGLLQAHPCFLPKERIALDTFPEVLLSMALTLQENGINAGQLEEWNASIGSYAFFLGDYFSASHDPSRVLGQDNLLRYVPQEEVVVRLLPGDTLFDAMRIIAAAWICGSFLELSGTFAQLEPIFAAVWCKQMTQLGVIEESEEEFIERMEGGGIRRLRLLSSPSVELQAALSRASWNVRIARVLANGRLELLHYLREVTLSIDYHRYGNLGSREGEARRLEGGAETACKTPCSPTCCQQF